MLLDDPLAAVDVKVANHLFKHAISGLLSGRAVILVTHHVHYAAQCDRVHVMENGALRLATKEELEAQISAHAPHTVDGHEVEEETEKEDAEDGSERGAEDSEDDVDEKLRLLASLDAPPAPSATRPKKNGGSDDDDDGTNGGSKDAMRRPSRQLVLEEDRKQGQVTWSTYVNYARAGGLLLTVLSISLFFVSQAVIMGSDYYLQVRIRWLLVVWESSSCFIFFLLSSTGPAWSHRGSRNPCTATRTLAWLWPPLPLRC